jgi:hypothetical protein
MLIAFMFYKCEQTHKDLGRDKKSNRFEAPVSDSTTPIHSGDLRSILRI